VSLTARCVECGEEFGMMPSQHAKRICTVDCADARERRRSRARKYGLTVEAYDALLERDDGCAICGIKESYSKRLHIDHDHACCPGGRSCGKCVRGLLCSSCNTGLGAFLDDAELLLKAINYLIERRVPQAGERILEEEWGTAVVPAGYRVQ